MSARRRQIEHPLGKREAARTPAWAKTYAKRLRCAAVWCAALFTCVVGCGRREAQQVFERPSEIHDFGRLFKQNCAGCHGKEGKLGPAPPLNDPIFLAIVPHDELVRTISEGRAGTLMPAFARAQGGNLTDEQIQTLAKDMVTLLEDPSTLDTGTLPEYKTPANTSDVHSLENREAAMQVFGLVCGTCHGERGQGGKEAGALRDPALLSLMSDQGLRRIIITGRPDLGMPNFRGLGAKMPAGEPLTSQQIADVVALLASWRHPHEPSSK